jgi:transposase InsO family protein
MGNRRGRLTSVAERIEIISLIEDAQRAGVRQEKACEVVGISARTLPRWKQSNDQVDGRKHSIKQPSNKLTELEQQRILQVANEPEYANLPSNKIVVQLLDKGVYIASESSFYRVLKANKQLTHRTSTKPNRIINKPRALVANKPNQIYTWDITYLPTRVKGQFFYLYLVLDIYSRKIVGWQVHQEELSALAADLMIDICQRENIDKEQVTLHSDNGSPMKGATMLATLQELGVMTSFSRPSVSNDNPYSESLFRTLKYRPEYPEKAFEDIANTRNWVEGFVDWYNHEHLHSGIKFVTPVQRHQGDDQAILANRKKVIEEAKSKHPNRWSNQTRDWSMVTEVKLNPEKCKTEIKEKQAA